MMEADFELSYMILYISLTFRRWLLAGRCQSFSVYSESALLLSRKFQSLSGASKLPQIFDSVLIIYWLLHKAQDYLKRDLNVRICNDHRGIFHHICICILLLCFHEFSKQTN